MSDIGQGIVDRLSKLLMKQMKDPLSNWNRQIRKQYWGRRYLSHDWEQMPGAFEPWHQRCSRCRCRGVEATHPCPYSEF